jgi:hypothetical protein
MTRETILYLDQPAAAAVTAAAGFFAARPEPVTIVHRARYSVSLVGPLDPLPAEAPPAGGTVRPEATRHFHSGDDRLLEPGAAQLAAVPVQVRPEWCRVWITTNGTGAASRAVEAYVSRERERSRGTQAAVRDLERAAYGEARWAQTESTLRATLQRQGLDADAIDAKVATLRQRWTAVARKAQAAGPEEPEPA